MVGEAAATLRPVSRATCTAWAAWLETYSGVLGTTGQPEPAGYDPAGVQRPARRSILAGCTAGWRSGGFGQTKRRRVNSLKWPTQACRSCGRGSHPATRSRGDSTRREAAPWYLVRSSSCWAGVVEVGGSKKRLGQVPIRSADSSGPCCDPRAAPSRHQRQLGGLSHRAIHSRASPCCGVVSQVLTMTQEQWQSSSSAWWWIIEPVDAVLESCRPYQGAAAAQGGAGCSWC